MPPPRSSNAVPSCFSSSDKTASPEANDNPETEPTPSETDSPETDGETANQGSEEEDNQARLVVIGNATFAADSFFDQQLNGDVFLNSVTWLSNLDDTILSIRPKEITNRRIVMTVSQQVLVIVLALLIFPLTGLIGAGITWFRRR